MQPESKVCLRIHQAGLGRHIGKSSIAIISVEAILAVVGQKQIFKTIVVVIADTHSTRPAGRFEQTGLFCYITKSSVAIVVVEAVAGSRERPPAAAR